MLQNRIYRGEIVHKERSYPGEYTPIIDQELWDMVQARLAGNAAQRKAGGRAAQPSLLAGMLFDADGNRMTPSHAVKEGTRYRYYASRPLITNDPADRSTWRRIPAGEFEQLVLSQVRQWLLDPGSIYKATSAWLLEPSAQQRLVAQAAQIGEAVRVATGAKDGPLASG
jgi:site-specific DNA recombinase